MPPGLDLLLMLVVFFALMYFLTIRPAQRRARKQQDTLAALEPGARVLLSGGQFATLRHQGDKQAIVELAPGTEISVLKTSILRPVATDEEEFEFSDETEFTEQAAVLAEDEVDQDDLDVATGSSSEFEQEFDPTPQRSQDS